MYSRQSLLAPRGHIKCNENKVDGPGSSYDMTDIWVGLNGPITKIDISRHDITDVSE